ncbi:Uncharacterized protein GBIM_14093 [Gryllus bimaculatus]|nr:Uncharacterized protein GBIM_14093 [Gryllus bimaculatus]
MAGPAVRALLLAALLSAGGGGGGGGGDASGGGYAAYAQQVAPCTFNSMCTCKLGGGGGGAAGPTIHLTTPRSLALVKDISCIGVPFAKMPELAGGAQVAHMDVVSSGLEALEGEALGAAQVESLRLMSNRIQLVGERAFASMSDALKSLDLSYNELDHVPFDALRPLKGLDWLNLHSNHIASLGRGGEGAAEADWGHLRESLSNLFLGENDLTELPTSLGDSPTVNGHLHGHGGGGGGANGHAFNGHGGHFGGNGGGGGGRNGTIKVNI